VRSGKNRGNNTDGAGGFGRKSYRVSMKLKRRGDFKSHRLRVKQRMRRLRWKKTSMKKKNEHTRTGKRQTAPDLGFLMDDICGEAKKGQTSCL